MKILASAWKNILIQSIWLHILLTNCLDLLEKISSEIVALGVLMISDSNVEQSILHVILLKAKEKSSFLIIELDEKLVIFNLTQQTWYVSKTSSRRVNQILRLFFHKPCSRCHSRRLVKDHLVQKVLTHLVDILIRSWQ